MSISMKDLQSSSDEEDIDYMHKILNHDTMKESKSKNTYVDTISTDKPPYPHDTDSTKSTTPQAVDDTKSPLKEKMSGLFEKTSNRITPTPSLDSSSFNGSFDGGFLSNNIVKTVSDSDIKATCDNMDGKDNVSKKQWFKGHINNYISKSKNYYYNRGTTAPASSESSLNSSLELSLGQNNAMRSAGSSVSLNNMPLSSSPVSTHSRHDWDNHASDSVHVENSILKLSSIATDASHLPLIKNGRQPGVTKNTYSQNLPMDLNAAVKTDPPLKSKIISSKLTFSELLHSNSSELSARKNADGTVTMLSPNDTLVAKEMVVTPSGNISDDFTELEIDILTNQIVKEDLKNHLRPNTGSSVTFFHLWMGSLFMYAYLLYTLPAFLSGIITGAIVMYLIGCMSVWLLCPSAESYDQYRNDLKTLLINDVQESKKPELMSGLPKAEVLQRPRDLKGWMNLAYIYDDVYEKELTKEVYVVVHEDSLFLFLTKSNITENAPNQKLKNNLKKNKPLLSQDSEEHAITFNYEYRIDLVKCLLHLKPDDLPVRRIWNKKYPLKLTVPCKALKKREVTLHFEQLTLDLNDIIDGMMDAEVISKEFSTNQNEEEFFFFSNTGREKEDWFYRMQLCVAPLKHQVSFTDLRKKRVSNQPSQSYPHYMTELIAESEKVMQRNVKGKKVEPYLAWLNIFLGRAFWDFWHDKYWTGKLHQKIQSRLSKINTPPFITDIKLKTLNCGHNIPIIHKGSLPVLDEYGVWTDLQVTYKGYFTLTLETQLNVDYYVGLVSGIVKQKSSTESQLSKMTKLSDLPSDSDEGAISNDKVEHKETSKSTMPNDMECGDENFHDEIPDVYFDTFDSSDGNMEPDFDPVMSDPRTKAFLESRAGKKVVGLVGWLAKSKLAKKVAETDFAKKAYEKAYEKFHNMPIILKVEIQSLRGNLAVNIPPPPTNRVWFGFRNNPVIFITASPKVGDKQVRLTYLTSWIEKKLKEEFKKSLVLPSMQDISIKLMDSHLKDIYPDRPMS